MTPAGRSRVTTAPAPTTVSCPIVNTRADDDADAQPHVVGERDGVPVLPTQPAAVGVDGMRSGQQLHARGDLTCGADCDRRDVEHYRVDVDERPVADADRSVLAVEGWPHGDVLADVPERAAEQRVTLLPCSRTGVV
jgi:hypothetical protein